MSAQSAFASLSHAQLGSAPLCTGAERSGTPAVRAHAQVQDGFLTWKLVFVVGLSYKRITFKVTKAVVGMHHAGISCRCSAGNEGMNLVAIEVREFPQPCNHGLSWNGGGGSEISEPMAGPLG